MARDTGRGVRSRRTLRRGPPRRALALLTGAALSMQGCAAFEGDASRDVRVKPQSELRRGEPVSQVELQQDIQRFGSAFATRVVEAAQPIYEDANAAVREQLLRRLLVIGSNTLEIATGPFPEINLVDMLVFVSLTRHALQQYWVPRVYGSKGRALAQAFVEAEADLWELSNKILTGEQQVQIRELILEWQRANPDRRDVEGVRFSEFASHAGAISAERAARARGLFGQIRAAAQTADQALLISERAMFLAQRMPFLIRAQARLGVQESISETLARLRDAQPLLDELPAMQPLLRDLVALSSNAALAARETRALAEAGEPYIELVAGRDDAAQGEAALGVLLARADRITDRSLSLVRELRTALPADPEQVMDRAEQRIDALARRMLLYLLLLGVGWSAAFWGGYYLVKRARRA